MAKRDSVVVVARGAGWLLAWPRAEWEALGEDEQRQVVQRQVALMSQNVPENGTQRRRRVGARTSSGASAHRLAGGI